MSPPPAPAPVTALRVQRRRTRGWVAPPGAVYVGRPSRWSNPFALVQVGTLWTVIDERGATCLREPGGLPAAERVWSPDRFGAAVFARRFFELHIGPMGSYEYGAADLADLRELAGRPFMCWCPLLDPNGFPAPCHADVLLEIANA